MPYPFMRQVNDALMPEGTVWTPEPGGYFDRFLDGCAGNAQAVLDDLERLAFIRNPQKVPLELLPDLEREYGISPDVRIPESDRRDGLSAKRYAGRSASLVRILQDAMDKAWFGRDGYGLMVTPNASPASNPGPILDNSFRLTAHAYPSRYSAGGTAAFAGNIGGYYLLNGDRYNSSPSYPQAGNFCARQFPSASSAGYYQEYLGYENEYKSPENPAWWPFIFFIGGAPTRNEDGSVASITTVQVPASRRQELHRLILRIKPVHAWAGMKVLYV